MTYGARWFGSRTYGDGNFAVISSTNQEGAITFTLVNTITVTGYSSYQMGAITFTLANDISVTGRNGQNGAITFTLASTILVSGKSMDGFGAGIASKTSDQKILWSYDLLGVQTMAFTEFLALEWEIRLQEREVLKWSLDALDPKVDYILLDGTVRWNNRRFIVKQKKPVRDEDKQYIYFEAEARWVELGDLETPGDFSLSDTTIDAGLANILSGSNWTYNLTGDTGFHSMQDLNKSTLNLLRSWAQICQKEIIFDTENRIITLVDQQGRQKSQGFRYGRDLETFSRKEEPVAATELWGYGRGDLALPAPGYIENYDYYTDLGLTLTQAQQQYKKVQKLKLGSVTDQADLIALCNEALIAFSQPQVFYEMSVKDLTNQSGYNFYDIAIGDTVPVWDPILGASQIFPRVVRLVRRPFEPWNSTVELGFVQLDLSSEDTSDLGTTGQEWILVKHDSDLNITLGTTTQIVNIIDVEFVNGEAVFGWMIDGTATGAGTVTIECYNVLTGALIGLPTVQPMQRLFVSGVFHEVFSFALKDLQG